MKKFKIVIGIDISKNKLDVCIIEDPTSKQHHYFIVSNDKKGINSIFKELKRYKVEDGDLLFCFENTGVYGMHLCNELQTKKVQYSMVPAIEIKRAKGLVRGKSDKADSKDIAMYAITHEHKLNLTTLPEADLLKLRLLLTEREKLIRTISLFDATKENEDFVDKAITKQVFSLNKKTMIFLKKQLVELEKSIHYIIEENETINKQFKLAKSVPGVGPQTAINLIVTTRCFTTFEDWRKLACYAGIAPRSSESPISSLAGAGLQPVLVFFQLHSVINLISSSPQFLS